MNLYKLVLCQWFVHLVCTILCRKMLVPQISDAETEVLMTLLLRNKQREIVLERGSMTAQHFRDLLHRLKRRLPACCIDQVDLVKIIFFRKKQYLTIKAMLKIRMFTWDSADLCVVDGPIAGARDYLVVSV